MEYLGHGLVYHSVNHIYTSPTFRYKCSVCNIFCDLIKRSLVFKNENLQTLDNISCNEYLIKKLLE